MTDVKTIKAGESLEAITLPPVSRIDLIKYAGASGDFNPIHTIDEEATAAGLPGIIAHGMWTMGNLTKLFTPYLEDGLVTDYQIRFRGMVFLDDVVTLHATVKDRDEKTITFEIGASKQNGDTALKGEASTNYTALKKNNSQPVQT
ncbi:MaoC/PaaZ C-terminal domain-containing protein [Geomicrobium sp. JCM 19055]|uniref:MaoC/PaaZ C-terminal domain-containing protein n=1 Tax=Geomicrobium sp. JCM 19055 TaxID=1460649 RepID=UPI00045ED15E|nr:MaoC/PaaZ C-terminal domain-containing protein [Geomicrobium sp. JCM 19055]GAJ97418.1 MaoC family protein [Geomicrobium sp. JCM 19055]